MVLRRVQVTSIILSRIELEPVVCKNSIRSLFRVCSYVRVSGVLDDVFAHYTPVLCEKPV
jgi:hypothetical protein